MVDKRFILQCTHFAFVAADLAILRAFFPKVFLYFSFIAYFTLYAFVAHNTFSFSRFYFLDERIKPTNKAVLITGCDTGFGNELANRLDIRGFQVFASCLFPEGEGATELKLNCSNRMHVLYLDVTKDKSVQEALSFVEHNLGSNDLGAVVNNAGVFKGAGVDFSSMEDFQVCIDVNTLGPVRVIKSFLPLLKKSRGRVINITSACARISFSDLCAYSISKTALLDLTDCLDQEMQPFGIKCISIEPESFNSPMFNEKLLSRHTDEVISKVSKDILTTYGENYFEKWKTSSISLFKTIANRKFNVVIDDIEKAVTEKYPEHVYKPRVSTFTRCLYYIHEIIPYEMFKFLMNVYKLFLEFPSPYLRSSEKIDINLYTVLKSNLNYLLSMECS